MTMLSESWPALLLLAVLLLLLFRRPLGWLLKLGARSALGLGFLALWQAGGLGLTLGVNAFNALTLGLLGLPGLGLLFLFRLL